MTTKSPGVEALVREFTARLVEAAEAQIRERLLSRVAAALGASPGAPSANYLKRREPGGTTAPRARRTPKLSAKTLAVRRLQGRYLGVLRALPPAARARVQGVAREKGVAAAVALAKSFK